MASCRAKAIDADEVKALDNNRAITRVEIMALTIFERRSIFCELILLTQHLLLLCRERGEVALKARTEVDVPAPEAAEQ